MTKTRVFIPIERKHKGIKLKLYHRKIPVIWTDNLSHYQPIFADMWILNVAGYVLYISVSLH